MEKENLDHKTSANYEGFSLVSGGLIYTITEVFRKMTKPEKELEVTALALALITWLPICVLAVFNGTVDDDPNTINFFQDFLVHVRFLLVVPFLILIEKIVDKSFVNYIKISDRIIPNSQQPAFNKLVKRLDKLTDSFIPEIIILVIIYLIVAFDRQNFAVSHSARNYLFIPGTRDLTISGWYYLLISLPIFQLLVFRWIWRWLVWLYSIIRISRFKLQIDPLHADQMAGLEYLNLVPLTFSFIIMAPSAVLSAIIGIDIIYNGALFKDYMFMVTVYVVLLPIILYAPLSIFTPLLIHAKIYGISMFGNLIRTHNLAYDKKWMDENHSQDEKLLGSIDNSSLADINGSYAPIQGMRILPIDFKLILLSFVLNVVPYIPLIFTYYSASELFKLIMKSVMGA